MVDFEATKQEVTEAKKGIEFFLDQIAKIDRRIEELNQGVANLQEQRSEFIGRCKDLFLETEGERIDYDGYCIREVKGRQSISWDEKILYDALKSPLHEVVFIMKPVLDKKTLNALFKAGKIPEDVVRNAQIIKSAEDYVAVEKVE